MHPAWVTGLAGLHARAVRSDYLAQPRHGERPPVLGDQAMIPNCPNIEISLVSNIFSNATVEYPWRDNPARQVAEAHKKVFRKRLRELSAAMGARHPAVLGDALLLLIEGIYVTGQQSEEGPAQSAATVAKLLIDVSVPKT
jgi:hypothetical protein